MADGKSKTKAGGPRTEVFAMRIDPKLKYLAEIAARKQRRSLANYVEWAIEQSLSTVYLEEPKEHNRGKTVADTALDIWDLTEADRVFKLAMWFPDLLTYEEQLIWRVIGQYAEKMHGFNEPIRLKNENQYSTGLIRDCWSEIKAFALGTGSKEALDSAIYKRLTQDK